MEQISFRRNDVIFRQGDPADCMYAVRSGAVAVVLDCGGPDETKLTELRAGQYLGEMGLLDSAPRSATAVSLSDDTVLERIAESDFQAFFDENPELLLSMLQQMSSRLRRITRDYAGACRITRDYAGACRTVADVVEAEKAGQDFSAALRHRIAKTLAGYESAAPADGADE